MKTIFAVIAVLALWFTSAPSHAAEPQTHYVNADSLNIRSAPVSGKTLRKLIRGEEVRVFSQQNGWALISGEGNPSEWVAARYLCATDGCWGVSACPCGGKANCTGPGNVRYCINLAGDKTYRSTTRTPASTYAPAAASKPGNPSYSNSGGGCPCSGASNCYGPRGGSYCITSGGTKRYR